MTILVVATSGCCSWRNVTQETNTAAARDFTFHGLNALHRGDAQQAQSLLQQAAIASPKDQRIRQHLAISLAEQGKLDPAIQQLELAIEHSPHDPRLYVELGKLYYDKGDSQRALQHARVALKIDRQMAEAWVLKGRCEEQQNDFESALASFYRATGMPNAPADTHLDVARVCRNLRRPLQELTALDLYTEQFPKDQIPLDAVMQKAEALVNMQQYRRAVEQLADAARRSDATPEIWIGLSQAKSMSGEQSDAIMTAMRAAERFPGDAEIDKLLGFLNDANATGSPAQTAGLSSPSRF